MVEGIFIPFVPLIEACLKVMTLNWWKDMKERRPCQPRQAWVLRQSLMSTDFKALKLSTNLFYYTATTAIWTQIFHITNWMIKSFSLSFVNIRVQIRKYFQQTLHSFFKNFFPFQTQNCITKQNWLECFQWFQKLHSLYVSSRYHLGFFSNLPLKT